MDTNDEDKSAPKEENAKKKSKKGKTTKVAKKSSKEDEGSEVDNEEAKKVKSTKVAKKTAKMEGKGSHADDGQAKKKKKAKVAKQSAKAEEIDDEKVEPPQLVSSESEKRARRQPRSAQSTTGKGAKSALDEKAGVKKQMKSKQDKTNTAVASSAAEERLRRPARKKGKTKSDKEGYTPQKKKTARRQLDGVERILHASAQQEAVSFVLGDEEVKKKSILPADASPQAAAESISSSEDDGDSSNDEVLPGAVRVNGNDASGDDIPLEEESFVPKQNPTSNTSPRENGELIVEAQLVDDTESQLKEVTRSERRLIEEETRARIFGELGEITQAQVVQPSDEEESDKDDSRNRIYLIGGISCLVVTLSLVLGLALGLRDNGKTTSPLKTEQTAGPDAVQMTSPPSSAPTGLPELYKTCNAKKMLQVGESIENVGLEDFGFFNPSTAPTSSGTSAGTSAGDDFYWGGSGTDVEKYGCFNSFNPTNPLACWSLGGVELYFRGTGLPVKVTLDSSDGLPFEADDCYSSLQVYELSQNPDYCGKHCLAEGVAYPRENEVAWITNQNAEYLIQVSGLYFGFKFDLMLQTNSDWKTAHGPTVPSVNTILPGSLVGLVATASQLGKCGAASAVEGPTAWYIVQGNSRIITASTCGLASGWDTQISVFTANQGANSLEPDWICVNGDDNSCGVQSRVVWLSENNELYYVVVHGASGNSGDFFLQLSTEGAAVVAGDDCATSSTINLNESILVPLSSATVDNDIHAVCPYDGGYFFVSAAIWHKVTGNSQKLSPQLECSISCDETYIQIVKSTGSGCSSFECVDEWNLYDCGSYETCDWTTELGVDYYVLVMYNGLSQPPDAGEVRLTVVSS